MDLRKYFTPDAMIKRMTNLPVLETPLMDMLFTERPLNQSAIISKSEFDDVVAELPLNMRGAPSQGQKGASGGFELIEPLPLNINEPVTGQELNDLRLFTNTSTNQWAAQRTDRIRKKFRMTTEAMCAQALTGAIAWPILLSNGTYNDYNLSFGSVLTQTADVKFDAEAATIKDVHTTLSAMKRKIRAKGFGGELVTQAGTDVFGALYLLAENTTSTAKMIVEIGEGFIIMGGFKIVELETTYTEPDTGTVVETVPLKTLRMVAKDAAKKIIYSAVDDLDANLRALPLFIKAVKSDDPSGWKIIGQSKPLPIVNPDGICTSQVLT